MATKTDVDNALMAWEVARVRATQEYVAWGALLQSHKSLSESMRDLGWTFSEAKYQFDQLSKSHSEVCLAALTDMDVKCADYQKIKAEYDNQKS